MLRCPLVDMLYRSISHDHLQAESMSHYGKYSENNYPSLNQTRYLARYLWYRNLYKTTFVRKMRKADSVRSCAMSNFQPNDDVNYGREVDEEIGILCETEHYAHYVPFSKWFADSLKIDGREFCFSHHGTLSIILLLNVYMSCVIIWICLI